MNRDILLDVQHLTMRFGGLVSVRNLSFQIERGGITALIGPNGAGKTTVFNCITGFYKPTEGMLRFIHESGEEYLLERLPGHHIAWQAKIARTFQNIRLFGGMTVLENLLVAQHNSLVRDSGFSFLGLLGVSSFKQAEREAIDRGRYWLDKVGLLKRANDLASSLPYGAQRQLEIIRAACIQPFLLCLDEPAAGLNHKEGADLTALLLSMRKEYNMSIMLIEHDMSVVMKISDHVIVLDYGEKIADGTPSEIQNNPKVIAAYLGVTEEQEERLKSDSRIKEEL